MSLRGSRRAFSGAAAVLAFLALALPPLARSQEIVRRVGRVTVRVDTKHAFPGGVLPVRLSSRGRLGAAWALLDGRRAPFYSERGVLRALVPVAAGQQPGTATLGIGLAARRGEQRIAMPVGITAREHAARTVALPVPFQALVALPEAARDARRLLAALRTESASSTPGPLRPPVAASGSGFGERRSYPGFVELESRLDGLTGEHHRGIDYPVPTGTPVTSPGDGTVILAEPLVLSGGTVAIDHGQGVISVLLHLSRIEVRAGQTVRAGESIALSGEGGLAPAPLLQWRVYLHEIAVDPLVLGASLGP